MLCNTLAGIVQSSIAISITLWVFHRILVWSANLTTLYLFSSLEKVAPSIAAAGKNQEVARDKRSGGSHKSEVPLQQLCHDAMLMSTILIFSLQHFVFPNMHSRSLFSLLFFLRFSFESLRGFKICICMYGKRTLRWLFSQHFQWLRSSS